MALIPRFYLYGTEHLTADHLIADKALVFVERTQFLVKNTDGILLMTDEQNESILCWFIKNVGHELYEIRDRIHRV